MYPNSAGDVMIYWLTGTAIAVMVIIIAGVLLVSYFQEQRRSLAIEDARWEQQEVEITGGKIAIEIVKVARWGKRDDQMRIVRGPERIMIIDPNDENSPSLQQANEAAALRMLAYNSVLRPIRRN
jgi:hypothetical protein